MPYRSPIDWPWMSLDPPIPLDDRTPSKSKFHIIKQYALDYEAKLNGQASCLAGRVCRSSPRIEAGKPKFQFLGLSREEETIPYSQSVCITMLAPTTLEWVNFLEYTLPEDIDVSELTLASYQRRHTLERVLDSCNDGMGDSILLRNKALAFYQSELRRDTLFRLVNLAPLRYLWRHSPLKVQLYLAAIAVDSPKPNWTQKVLRNLNPSDSELERIYASTELLAESYERYTDMVALQRKVASESRVPISTNVRFNPIAVSHYGKLNATKYDWFVFLYNGLLLSNTDQILRAYQTMRGQNLLSDLSADMFFYQLLPASTQAFYNRFGDPYKFRIYIPTKKATAPAAVGPAAVGPAAPAAPAPFSEHLAHYNVSNATRLNLLLCGVGYVQNKDIQSVAVSWEVFRDEEKFMEPGVEGKVATLTKALDPMFRVGYLLSPHAKDHLREPLLSMASYMVDRAHSADEPDTLVQSVYLPQITVPRVARATNKAASSRLFKEVQDFARALGVQTEGNLYIHDDLNVKELRLVHCTLRYISLIKSLLTSGQWLNDQVQPESASDKANLIFERLAVVNMLRPRYCKFPIRDESSAASSLVTVGNKKVLCSDISLERRVLNKLAKHVMSENVNLTRRNRETNYLLDRAADDVYVGRNSLISASSAVNKSSVPQTNRVQPESTHEGATKSTTILQKARKRLKSLASRPDSPFCQFRSLPWEKKFDETSLKLEALELPSIPKFPQGSEKDDKCFPPARSAKVSSSESSKKLLGDVRSQPAASGDLKENSNVDEKGGDSLRASVSVKEGLSNLPLPTLEQLRSIDLSSFGETILEFSDEDERGTKGSHSNGVKFAKDSHGLHPAQPKIWKGRESYNAGPMDNPSYSIVDENDFGIDKDVSICELTIDSEDLPPISFLMEKSDDEEVTSSLSPFSPTTPQVGTKKRRFSGEFQLLKPKRHSERDPSCDFANAEPVEPRGDDPHNTKYGRVPTPEPTGGLTVNELGNPLDESRNDLDLLNYAGPNELKAEIRGYSQLPLSYISSDDYEEYLQTFEYDAQQNLSHNSLLLTKRDLTLTAASQSHLGFLFCVYLAAAIAIVAGVQLLRKRTVKSDRSTTV